ncbi:MAG: R3H domain-containing nucleic acid-binding protein [Patescibacteria group bacterium]|nr:R3H domain-containing nucleic acid-binding protein [Patescibacteria group bacterium]
MQLEEKKKLIEETTKDLLDRMSFKTTIYTSTTIPPEEETSDNLPISVEIQLAESKYLIGKFGVNLAALQHLLRIMIRKKAGEQIDFNVDVNGYREKQRQSIINFAQESAEKAMQEKKSVVLRPMNAFERRLVHVELSQTDGVKTESIGEGEERKVVIKPSSISEQLDL